MDADTRQDAAYAALVDRLMQAAPAIAAAVTADLGSGRVPPALEERVRRTLRALAGRDRLGPSELSRLRGEGAAAARAGVPLADPIDEALSTAWVTWSVATRLTPAPEAAALARLGGALLRGGDDAAAALADGYTAAERAVAARAGATRHAVLEELLTHVGEPSAADARLMQRAALVGLDPAVAHVLLLIRADRAIDEEGPAVEEISRRLARDPARRSHLTAVRDGDVVVILGTGRGPAPDAAALLAGVPLPEPWWAVVTRPVGIRALAEGHAEASDAIRAARAVGAAGRPVAVDVFALERALLADPALAAAAVDRWLGPLDRTGRGGAALVPTLEAYFGARESVVAAARQLGVAPRTVTYRLARVAELLGVASLDAQTRPRLVTALLLRRLIEAPDRPSRPPRGRC
jgi:hypothetical protein